MPLFFPDPRFYDLTSWGGISAHFRYRRKKGSRYARNPRLTHKQSLTSHPFLKPEPYEIIIVAGNCDDVGKVSLMAREFSQTEKFPKSFFTLKKPSRQSSHHPTPRPCRRINSIIKRALPTHDARFARSTIRGKLLLSFDCRANKYRHYCRACSSRVVSCQNILMFIIDKLWCGEHWLNLNECCTARFFGEWLLKEFD